MTGDATHESDQFDTQSGELRISFLGHGSLMFAWNEMLVHVDPYGEIYDYSQLPAADLILITHEHADHLDPTALGMVRKPDTQIVHPQICSERISGGIVMHNGDMRTILGIRIEAVPAYNRIHMRPDGKPYHPQGLGNGYVLGFDDFRVYVAGDTENIPEMQQLKAIDCAFLPMNIPYTMTPEMAADAARMFQPHILYPYHFGQTDPTLLLELLRDDKAIEVRIGDLA